MQQLRLAPFFQIFVALCSTLKPARVCLPYTSGAPQISNNRMVLRTLIANMKSGIEFIRCAGVCKYI